MTGSSPITLSGNKLIVSCLLRKKNFFREPFLEGSNNYQVWKAFLIQDRGFNLSESNKMIPTVNEKKCLRAWSCTTGLSFCSFWFRTDFEREKLASLQTRKAFDLKLALAPLSLRQKNFNLALQSMVSFSRITPLFTSDWSKFTCKIYASTRNLFTHIDSWSYQSFVSSRVFNRLLPMDL